MRHKGTLSHGGKTASSHGGKTASSHGGKTASSRGRAVPHAGGSSRVAERHVGVNKPRTSAALAVCTSVSPPERRKHA